MPGPYRHIHDNPQHRRRAQVVFVDKATNDVILRLHETDIVRVKRTGDVILSTGGWATHKTINGINDALQLFGMFVEAADGNPPRGNWQVYDVDGTIIPYTNDRVNYTITIKAKGHDAHNRCKWLAGAFNVPYNPTTTPPLQLRVVSVPARPAAMQQALAAAAAAPAPAPAVAAAPAPAQPAMRSAPVVVVVAAPPALRRAPSTAAPPRQPGPYRSWAQAAAAGVQQEAGTPAGPAAGTSSQPIAPASPGNSSLRALDVARQKLAAGAPGKPVHEQLAEHMTRLGIDDAELADDTHLCVVCMESLRTIVLVPCGHMALCKQCCQMIIVDQGKECPLCCQPVQYHVEVDA